MNTLKKIICISILSMFPLILSAHPHMAIYSNCEFVFEDSQIVGAWVDFSFDDYFTADILAGYDENHDELFNESETEEIYNHAFINLKNYGFFISIRDKTGRYSPEDVKDFSVYMKNEMITYRFYFDINSPADKEFYFSVFDPTFFCACYFNEKDTVTVNSDRQISTDYTIEENTDNPVYYNPYGSISDKTTYTKMEPGLLTFYPEEIHFVY